MREGTIKYKYILPQKGGQKASTLEGESAITPASYQVEQITPPLAREGAINHINHILCPIELPTPSPNIRESAMKKLPRRVVKGKPRNTVTRDITSKDKVATNLTIKPTILPISSPLVPLDIIRGVHPE